MRVCVHWFEPTVFQIFLSSGIFFGVISFRSFSWCISPVSTLLFYFLYFSFCLFYLFNVEVCVHMFWSFENIWRIFEEYLQKCNNNNKNHIGSYSCIIWIALFRVLTPTWKIISHKPLFIADFMATAKKPDGTNK